MSSLDPLAAGGSSLEDVSYTMIVDAGHCFRRLPVSSLDLLAAAGSALGDVTYTMVVYIASTSLSAEKMTRDIVVHGACLPAGYCWPILVLQRLASMELERWRKKDSCKNAFNLTTCKR